ncbi:hypothetical protein AC1031_012901 [Aphanomyces cochlioides]|nr:hypothetical protein AC1031_012901 [Aphanomyces cochlioides]
MAQATSPFHLELRGGNFYDVDDNVVLLRGVNLGGSTKVPFGTSSNGQVTFVNRPFPLKDADEHYGRLQRWGFNCLRFLITWEAIEHEGPGVYDQEYLSYLREVLLIARKYGMYIYIDPHQDVWSRWTGGDGAPLWTMVDLGLNPDNFAVTKAALCQDTFGGKPEDFPKMIWPTNMFKFGCATMATLFWAGNKLAPGVLMHGTPVQDFLQSHYTNAMVQVAKVVADMDHVMGFGTMNEPCEGFIGVKDIQQHFSVKELKLGYAPTPFQGMCLANGIDTEVEVWSTGASSPIESKGSQMPSSIGLNQYIFGTYDRKDLIKLSGKRAWQDGVTCIWERLGLYSYDEETKKPKVLLPDYFANVNFGEECYVSFATAYIEEIRKVMPQAMLFVELPQLEFMTGHFPQIKIPRSVNAMHWYDVITLFLQKWFPWFTLDPHSMRPVFGRSGVRSSHIKDLASIKALASEYMGNAPTLIGEIGIPFNLNGGESYVTGNFDQQVDAMDTSISSVEANLLNYTLWCYTADNDNKFGDQWNMEDFSLYSADQAKGGTDRDAGGRAKPGYVRPGPFKVAGVPTASTFDLNKVTYTLEYKSTSATNAGSTIVYVPRSVHFKEGASVVVSDGDFRLEHFEGYDLVHYTHDPKLQQHSLTVKRMINVEP